MPKATLFIRFALPFVAFTLLMSMMGQRVYAQSRDSLLAIYNNQTIHSFGTIYMKGSQRLRFRDLNTEFRSDVTRDLYKQSRKSLTLSRVLSAVSFATLVSGAVLRKNQNDAGFGLLVVGIGINLVNGRIRKKSTELVDRALWEHNKEVLFSQP